MKTVTEANATAEHKRIFEEKKWLMWLLKVWDDNDRKPSRIMVKRNWPEEYKQVLTAVGPWELVERRLDDVYKTRQEIAQECALTEMQAVRSNYNNAKSLEKHILGLIKLQEYLGTNRSPTYVEIAKYSKELGIPNDDSYLRTLVSKENWQPCIQGYLATTPDNRAEFLRNKALELYEQWKAKRYKANSNRLPRHYFTDEQCLKVICEVYDHFGKIPSQKEIANYLKQKKGYPSLATLITHIGCISKWVPLIVNYRMDQEIDRYLANCGDLKITTGPKNLDSLLRKLEKVASVNDKLEIEAALKKIRGTTKKDPAQFEIEIAGQEYEVIVRKKR